MHPCLPAGERTAPSYRATLALPMACLFQAQQNAMNTHKKESMMGTEASSNPGNAPEASTTLGVGGETSGQRGATPSRETQAETGGSGGAQLTQSQGLGVGAPAGQAGVKARDGVGNASPTSSAMESGATGAQDTRSQQGGGTGTGLGSPESGANQSPADLPPPR